MTPREVRLLMFAYESGATPSEWPTNYVANLVKDGLIEQSENSSNFIATPRGSVLANCICNLPLPVPTWSMPDAPLR